VFPKYSSKSRLPHPVVIGCGNELDNVWCSYRPKNWNLEREEQQY